MVGPGDLGECELGKPACPDSSGWGGGTTLEKEQPGEGEMSGSSALYNITHLRA